MGNARSKGGLDEEREQWCRTRGCQFKKFNRRWEEEREGGGEWRRRGIIYDEPLRYANNDRGV